MKKLFKGPIKGLLRVVKYNRRFEIVDTYTVWEINAPRVGDTTTRIYCDALIVNKPLQCTMIKPDETGNSFDCYDFDCYAYRHYDSEKDEYFLVIPSYGVIDSKQGFDDLMKREREWHIDHGEFYL